MSAHPASGQEFTGEGLLKIKEVSADKNYGRTEKKSIKVGKIENQKYYLNALTGPNGEPVSYRRLGSCCAFRSRKAAFGKGRVTDRRAASIIFRVAIGFVVNCEGETGNFQIIMEGEGDLRELAQQALEKVKTMPGNLARDA